MMHSLEARHCAAMSALHTACFPRGWSADELAEMLAIPQTLALGISDGPQLQAMLIVRSAGDVADILTLAVTDAHRRKGLAQQLMQAACATLKQEKVERLLLEVAVVNEAAIALYLRLGFAEISRRVQYYRQPDGTRADALVMEYRL